jgi:hypothetical protein
MKISPKNSGVIAAFYPLKKCELQFKFYFRVFISQLVGYVPGLVQRLSGPLFSLRKPASIAAHCSSPISILPAFLLQTIKARRVLILGILFIAALLPFTEVAAQTITGVTVTGAPVCAGSNVSVSFLATNGGTGNTRFTTATVYSVVISGSATPITFTSLTAPANSNNANATITQSITVPSTTTAGSHTITVTSSAPTNSGTNNVSASFTVNATPSISVQPSTSAQNLCLNATATTLSVTASLSSGSLNYQWYSNTTSSNSGGTIIGGATSSTYTPPTTSAGTRYYYVVASNSGICPATSNVSGAVTVSNPPDVSNFIASAATTCAGSTATVTVNSSTLANGTYTITYNVSGTNTVSSTTASMIFASGTGTFSTSALSIQGSSNVVNITAVDLSGCVSSLTYSTSTFTTNARPTSVISGTATICNGSSSQVSIALTGTQPWSVTYTDGTTPTTVNGVTTSPYTFSVSTTKTYTVSALSDATCSSISADRTGSATITVQNAVTAGVIATAQTICNAGDPAAFTSTTAGTGSGVITYRWESATSPFSAWSSVGVSTATYDAPSGLTVTTQYRRITISTQNAVVCESSPTSTIEVSVQSVPTAGAINNAQTICNAGDPAAFTSTTGGTGSSTITYRWESSVSPFTVWSTIGGASSATYDAPSGLTATTQYRRVTISTLNSVACESSATSPVQITVQTAPTAGAITGAQTICNGGDPAVLGTNTDGTGAGTITYRWESSVSPFSVWSTIGGASSNTYDPPSGLTATTEYRRITISTLNSVACESSATTSMQVTVQFIPTGGTVASNQSICSGSIPAAFTQSVASTGSATTLTYQWQSSTTSDFSAGVTTIAGATSTTYTPVGALTTTTYFRRVTTSTVNSVGCTANSNTITVTVTPLPNVTSLTASVVSPVCTGTGITVNVNAPNLPNGTYNITYLYNPSSGGNQTPTASNVTFTGGAGSFTSVALTTTSAAITITNIASTTNTSCSTSLSVSAGSATSSPAPSTSISVTASNADSGNPNGSTVSIRSKSLVAGTSYTVAYTIVGINGNTYPSTPGSATFTMSAQAKGPTKLGTFTSGQLAVGQYQLTINSIAFTSTNCSAATNVSAQFSIQSGFATVMSGTWNTPGVWGTIGTGPNYLDGPITISAGHTITMADTIALSSAWGLDQFTINGTLIIESGMTLTIYNGTGTDLTIGTINPNVGSVIVNGTLAFNGDVSHLGTSSSNTTFNASSQYKHQATTTEGVPPTASWNATSTFTVEGYTSAAITCASAGWSQNFAGFTWNCPSQTADVNLNGLLGALNSSVRTIQGNVNITNTGTGRVRFAGGTAYTLTIPGNLNVSGTARFGVAADNANNADALIKMQNFNYTSSGISYLADVGKTNLDVLGNISISGGGTLYCSSGSGNITNSGTTMNITGNFTNTGCTINASDSNADRIGLLIFNDKNAQGNTSHTFTNTGTISGRISYQIANGHTVRTVDESPMSGTGQFTMDANSRLILESVASNGAIQDGTTGGNVRVALRSIASTSTIEYGRTASPAGKQYITSLGHPSTVGLQCIINNASGVDVSTNGTAITIGGNLIVQSGDLTVKENDLSVTGTSTLTSGNIVLSASGEPTGRNLTLNGNVALTGGGMQVTSGASDSENANVFLNGDITGTQNFTFTGNNSNVTIAGTTPTTFSRSFPIAAATTFETFTLNRPGSNLSIAAYPLTIGFSGNIANTSGLFVTNGDLKINGSLLVTHTTQISIGSLDFSGQAVELRQAISTNASGLLLSDASSSLSITSAYEDIVPNELYFSNAAHTVNALTLNRTGVSTLVNLRTPLTVNGTFSLTAGQFDNSGNGLTMGNVATSAAIVRTPDGAFTALSPTPLGGPYSLTYNDGTGTSLSTAQEAEGSLNHMTSNLTGVGTLTTAMSGIGDMTINNGTFDCGAHPVSMNSLFNYGVLTAPSTTLTLTGNFANGNSGGDSFNANSGTVFFTGSGTAVVSGTQITNFHHITLDPKGLTFPAAEVRVSGDLLFNAGSTFTHSNGTVEFNGTDPQTITPSNAVAAQTGKFHNITINRVAASGEAILLAELPFAGLLDMQAGILNSNGFLTVLSQDNFTDNDARIGTIEVGAQVTGNVNVQRAMAAAGTENRYIGMPTQNVPVSALQDDFSVTGAFTGNSLKDPQPGYAPCTNCDLRNPFSIRYYTETFTGASSNGYRNFPRTSNTETFTVGRGYLAYMYAAQFVRWDVTGEITQGDFAFPVTYTKTLSYSASTSALNDGWNLISNPYASPITWKSNGWERLNIDPVISVPDLGSDTAYPTYYKAYNWVDGSGSYYGSSMLPNGIIATGQAFWVHVTAYDPDPNNTKLIISEDAKLTPAESGGQFYREATSSTSQQLIVAISDGKHFDESFLKLNAKATRGIDLYDGYKKKNEFMNVYLIDDENRTLVMHTLPSIKTEEKISLGVEVIAAGEYSFSFNNTKNDFLYADELTLIDLVEERSHAISTGPYEFSIKTSGEINDRFYLTRSPGGSENRNVSLFPNPSRDFLNVNAGENANVTIHNFSGNIVRRVSLQREGKIDVRDLASGLYIVKIQLKDRVIASKFIKN